MAIVYIHRTDWATAKTLLGDSNFLRKLVEYPKDTISDSLLKKLQKYVENPDFVPAVIEKVSKACKSLCMWVRALELYARVYRTVEPKRKRLIDLYLSYLPIGLVLFLHWMINSLVLVFIFTMNLSTCCHLPRKYSYLDYHPGP